MEQRTAVHVDHEHSRLCLCQYLLIQHVPITGIERAGEYDEIRLPDALRPNRTLDALDAAISFDARVVSDDRHVERGQALGDAAADVTKTDQRHALARQAHAGGFGPFPR